MLKEFSLEGKVAIVTGAGREIRRSIALTISEAGANTVAVAETKEAIEETADEIGKLGKECLPIPTDITKSAQVEKMVEESISRFGKIDILANNVGTLIMKALVPLPEVKTHLSEILPNFDTPTTEEEWHLQRDTNVTGAFLCLRAIAPHMIRQKKGKIINISSIEAMRGFTYHAPYAATKGALNALTRALALEWARYHINVNAIGPDHIRTKLSEFGHEDEKLREGMLRSIPLRRFLQPREIGLLATYLASEASDHITGQTIYIDGGVTS